MEAASRSTLAAGSLLTAAAAGVSSGRRVALAVPEAEEEDCRCGARAAATRSGRDGALRIWSRFSKWWMRADRERAREVGGWTCVF